MWREEKTLPSNQEWQKPQLSPSLAEQLINPLVTWWRRRAAPRVGFYGRTRRRPNGRTAAWCLPRRASLLERSWGRHRAPETWTTQHQLFALTLCFMWKWFKFNPTLNELLDSSCLFQFYLLLVDINSLDHIIRTWSWTVLFPQSDLSHSTIAGSESRKVFLNAPWRPSSCWGSRCRWCSVHHSWGCPHVWRNLLHFLGNTPPWPKGKHTQREQVGLDLSFKHLKRFLHGSTLWQSSITTTPTQWDVFSLLDHISFCPLSFSHLEGNSRYFNVTDTLHVP